MRLITEELPEMEDPTAAAVTETLDSDAFGKFAVLLVSDDEFVQAGNDWTPTDECAEYLRAHDSDPWVLEYRKPALLRPLRADGVVTLAQVKDVFLAFLAGDTSWQTQFLWCEIAES